MFLQGKIIKDKCSKGCLSEQLQKEKNSLSIIMFDFDSSQSDDHF